MLYYFLSGIYLLRFVIGIGSDEFIVSSYNLWNVMFNWDVRKYYIAKMIKETKSDVIGFQEVCFTGSDGYSQLIELQKLLPEYPYIAAQPANTVTKVANSYWTHWNREGIGLLSKHPIISWKIQQLPYLQGPDINHRIALHAKIMKDSILANVIVIHFSYDRMQQCHNAASVYSYIQDQRLSSIVLLGDFNLYNDFEWPVQIFTGSVVPHESPCYQDWQAITGMMKLNFRDAGSSTQLTFSNMPEPGLQSRPDRILVSPPFLVKDVLLFGYGKKYKSLYSTAVFLNRLKTVVISSFHSSLGAYGYPCVQDCGPHGFCRCGLCVKKDNDSLLRDCNFPNCYECNSFIFLIGLIYVILLVFLIVTLGFALVRVLTVSSVFQQNSHMFRTFGCNCCLCHSDLFSSPVASRPCRYRYALIRYNLLCWLPTYGTVLVCVMLLVLMYAGGCWFFFSTLKTVYSSMEEEYFPSDHLLLTATLTHRIEGTAA